MPDHQTAVNALVAGEIDILEAPPHDLLPILTESEDILLHNNNPLGNQYMFRMTWLPPPFDNQKTRQAAIASLAQQPFPQAPIGNPSYSKDCAAMFVCAPPSASPAGGD